jgi:hypothetical protein
LKDDQKGVDEALNETELYDFSGLRVNAKYYMHIFDTLKG